MGGVVAAAFHRWARVIVAIALLALIARTRFYWLAYLALVPAALAIGSPALRSSLDKWTQFWQ